MTYGSCGFKQPAKSGNKMGKIFMSAEMKLFDDLIKWTRQQYGNPEQKSPAKPSQAIRQHSQKGRDTE